MGLHLILEDCRIAKLELISPVSLAFSKGRFKGLTLAFFQRTHMSCTTEYSEYSIILKRLMPQSTHDATQSIFASYITRTYTPGNWLC